MAQAIVNDEVELGARVAGGPVPVLRKGMTEWLFLLPALVFFIGYQVWPIVRVLWLSFTNFQLLSDKPAQWVGFDNYAQALHDPLMWASLGRAALFTIMFLPGTIILPLLLAILVDRVGNQRLATLYRVILLIPAVIPSTLIFVLWKWMYNYQSGPINHLLVNTFGLFTVQNAPQWLGGTRAHASGDCDHGSLVGPRLPHDLLHRRPRRHSQGHCRTRRASTAQTSGRCSGM